MLNCELRGKFFFFPPDALTLGLWIWNWNLVICCSVWTLTTLCDWRCDQYVLPIFKSSLLMSRFVCWFLWHFLLSRKDYPSSNVMGKSWWVYLLPLPFEINYWYGKNYDGVITRLDGKKEKIKIWQVKRGCFLNELESKGANKWGRRG